MAKTGSIPVLQMIHRLVEDPRVKKMADQELLASFRTNRDGDAFHALVRRHGSMVLEVCRNVLRNESDAAVCACFAGKVKGTPAFKAAEVQAAAIVAALTGK